MKVSKLIVALDVEDKRRVEKILAKLGPAIDFYKVGLRLFTHYGPEILQLLKRHRKKIFLDLKLHDIPTTVAQACGEIVRHRVQMFTVHCSGGRAMLEAAVQTVKEESKRLKIPKPDVMGVTVLTSMDLLDEIGINSMPEVQVLRLAKLAADSGLDGVICSPREIGPLKESSPKKFKIVTPGVRPEGTSADDQKRVMTPQEAFRLGADAVVVGRPILQAEDPLKMVRQILAK